MRSGVRFAGVSDPLPLPQAAEGPTMKARSSLLCVAVALLVIAAVPSHAQSPAAPAAPIIPPGPQQIITPKIDVPTPTPAVIPTPDDLDVGLQISATLDGEPVDANPITMEPGQLLVLTLTGADLDKTPRNAAWTLNREAKGRIFHDSTQRCLSFTATAKEADSYLFTAAVNGLGEDARPDVVARWVVVSGKGPQPPPKPDVPDPPKPEPPAPVSGVRRLVIVRESTNDTAELSRLLINLRDGTAADYLKSKGHTFDLLDPDDKDPDGTTSDNVELWKPFLVGLELPAVVEIDAATNKVVHKYSLPSTATAADVIASLKEHGG